MRVIAVPLARCMWLIKEMNPGGRSLLDALHGVAKHYRFSKFPAHLLDTTTDNALQFKSGTFLMDGGDDVRVGLTVFNNGLMADSLSSTDNSEAFLEDLRKFLAKEHNLPIDDSMITQKAYVSQLELQTDVNWVRVDPKFEEIAREISAKCVTLDGKPRQYEIGGIGIWSEDVSKDNAPQSFKLERKWGPQFPENIYYSQAPLRTQEHVKILEELEAAFRS